MKSYLDIVTQGNSDVRKRIAKAKATNAERDRVDRSCGNAAPGDIGNGDLLRTAMLAVTSGLQTLLHTDKLSSQSLDCIAEGLVMLDDLHSRIERRTP